MKRLYMLLFMTVIAVNVVIAQELTVTGELKTGFYLEEEKIGDNESEEKGSMKSTDEDSSQYEGRARLGFHLSYENIGLIAQFKQEVFGGTGKPEWEYVFAYGNLFDNQFGVSAGLLGLSPWSIDVSTMGIAMKEYFSGNIYKKAIRNQDLIKSLETKASTTSINTSLVSTSSTTGALIGIRFEYRPSFLPGLNVGLVLNQSNNPITKKSEEREFGELLKETVVGVAYENDYFDVRFAYRFDGDDVYETGGMNEGTSMIYQLEERLLRNTIPGMKIWLSGYWYGILADENQPSFIQHWFNWQWDTDNFIASLSVFFMDYGKNNNEQYMIREKFQSFEIFPGFLYKLSDNLFHVGLNLGFGMEFGEGKVYIDSPYQYIYVEPQIKLFFNTNAYMALVYNFTESYAAPSTDRNIEAGDKSQKHWLNLRVCFTL